MTLKTENKISVKNRLLYYLILTFHNIQMQMKQKNK